MKGSANMYASSDSQFFRTTTGMQSGVYLLDKLILFSNCYLAVPWPTLGHS